MIEAKGNILVIDDDPLVLMNNCDILEDAGYTPTEAQSAVQGLNIASSREFDLIICDHDLGDGKGIDILIKLLDSGSATPVIYLSGAQQEILTEVSKLATVKQALSKPVSEQALLEAVETAIKVIEGDRFPRLIGDDERAMLLDNPFLGDFE